MASKSKVIRALVHSLEVAFWTLMGLKYGMNVARAAPVAHLGGEQQNVSG
jgi:hypothetical protein